MDYRLQDPAITCAMATGYGPRTPRSWSQFRGDDDNEIVEIGEEDEDDG